MYAIEDSGSSGSTDDSVDHNEDQGDGSSVEVMVVLHDDYGDGWNIPNNPGGNQGTWGNPNATTFSVFDSGNNNLGTFGEEFSSGTGKSYLLSLTRGETLIHVLYTNTASDLSGLAVYQMSLDQTTFIQHVTRLLNTSYFNATYNAGVRTGGLDFDNISDLLDNIQDPDQLLTLVGSNIADIIILSPDFAQFVPTDDSDGHGHDHGSSGHSGDHHEDDGDGSLLSIEAVEANNAIQSLPESDLTTLVKLQSATKTIIEGKNFNLDSTGILLTVTETRAQRKRYINQIMKQIKQRYPTSNGKLIVDRLPNSVITKRTHIIEAKQDPTDSNAPVIPVGEMIYTPLGVGDFAQ